MSRLTRKVAFSSGAAPWAWVTSNATWRGFARCWNTSGGGAGQARPQGCPVDPAQPVSRPRPRKQASTSLTDVEFRAFSQNSKDRDSALCLGLLGIGRHRCVEICAGNGIECNTANLIVNHGWSGLLFDADKRLVERRPTIPTR